MIRDANLWAYVGLTVLAMVAVTEWADPSQPAGDGCRVGYVYDGDSVEMICGTTRSTARLIGIDTPELTEPRCAAEKTAAEAAKRALAELVKSARSATIEIDGHDRYGRDLIHLTLDGQDAAEAMISAGQGRPYDGGPRQGWCD